MYRILQKNFILILLRLYVLSQNNRPKEVEFDNRTSRGETCSTNKATNKKSTRSDALENNFGWHKC